jgi:hypothetical protein
VGGMLAESEPRQQDPGTSRISHGNRSVGYESQARLGPIDTNVEHRIVLAGMVMSRRSMGPSSIGNQRHRIVCREAQHHRIYPFRIPGL